MRRVGFALVLAVIATGWLVGAIDAATRTESSRIGLNLCPGITTTIDPVPPAGPTTYGCNANVAASDTTTASNPADLGSFCLGQNPIGAGVHVSGSLGEGVPG